MPRLIPCSSCHSHVMVDDRECPHCGASLQTTTALRAPAVLMGLALTACPVLEPDYGVAETGEPTTTGRDTETVSDSSSGSSGGTSTGMTGDGTSSGTSTEGSSSLGEPEYGVAETSTSAGEPDYGVAETTTGASTSVGEPEYGVPETSGASAGEPDYGVPETPSR